MNERVTLKKPVITEDKFGSPRTEYVDVKTVHAEIQWKGGSTGLEAGELFMNERIDVLIRIQHKIEEGWRVQQIGMNRNLFHISAIEPNREKGFNRLVCERVNE